MLLITENAVRMRVKMNVKFHKWTKNQIVKGLQESVSPFYELHEYEYPLLLCMLCMLS